MEPQNGRGHFMLAFWSTLLVIGGLSIIGVAASAAAPGAVGLWWAAFWLAIACIIVATVLECVGMRRVAAGMTADTAVLILVLTATCYAYLARRDFCVFDPCEQELSSIGRPTRFDG